MKRLFMRGLLTVLLFGITLSVPQGSAEAYDWLDGKLEVRGNLQQTMNIRAHQDDRSIQFSSFRSVLRGEARWTLADNPNSTLHFYTIANYYYDWALDIDEDQRHAVRDEAGRRHYRDARTPRDSAQWLTECYLDWGYCDWLKVRLGKQLVSWGETAESRVADVINPLDTTYLTAFPDWEDFKIGLWMARIFLTPQNMPQELSLEFLVIPFDFKSTRLAPAGTGNYIGAPALPNQTQQRILNAFRRDTPNYDIRNCEAGIRIRGYAKIGEGVDWTLSHFYSRLDSPLVDGPAGNAQFFSVFVRSAVLGLDPYRDALGNPINQDIYTYPFFNSTAFTFSTTWDLIGCAVRGETVYNANRDYQFVGGQIKEKELINTSLRLDKAVLIPYLSDWNNATSYSFSLTAQQLWLLNWEEGIAWEVGSNGPGDSRQTKFSGTVSTSFWFGRIITVGNIVYDTNGSNAVVANVVFQPGDHWQWLAVYQQFNEYRSSAVRYGSQVILSMRYEFW